MKLLVITQKIDQNDDVLGFMHGWLAEFAKNCQEVVAIALGVGSYDLPGNVKVFSLGKEKKYGFLKKIKYLMNFYKYIWQERANYDAVFVHMNREYVILGGLFWKIWRKKIGLWYAHGHVPLDLRLAASLADIIFTSTASGFRLANNKVKVIGQGIDVNKFTSPNQKIKSGDKNFKIITVGRISPVKGYETLIAAAKILRGKGFDFTVDIIGGPGTPEQKEYFERLKRTVNQGEVSGLINFIGAVPNSAIISYLQSADLFVNMSYTGSLDKAMVEAMACGLPVLSCNEAMEEVLGSYRSSLMYHKGDAAALAGRIEYVLNLSDPDYQKISSDLRIIVERQHSLANFIRKIINLYQNI